MDVKASRLIGQKRRRNNVSRHMLDNTEILLSSVQHDVENSKSSKMVQNSNCRVFGIGFRKW